jgi:hypothetical protein
MAARLLTCAADDSAGRLDLSLRSPRFPVSLEKWYVDVLFDDGAVLLVYLVRLHFFGVRMARVTAELFEEGRVIRGDAAASRIEGGPDWLRFGGASIEGDRFRFSTPGLEGDLVYRPRHDPFTLRDPFVTDGDRALTWRVEIPDADVEGTLRWPGGLRTVRARGYRDRVHFDIPPWRFPIERLVWGRAIAGEHATTWVEADTARGRIADRWASSEQRLELDEPRVLIDAHVLGLPTLGLSWRRALLEPLSGDPHERKMAAPCRLGGEQGVAIHEVVTFSGTVASWMARSAPRLATLPLRSQLGRKRRTQDRRSNSATKR